MEQLTMEKPMLKIDFRKAIAFAFVLTSMILPLEAKTMNSDWFLTWDRPEYQEWAKEIPEGYLLHIIRKEPDNFLVVQAKLLMGEKGLPGFEVIEQRNAATEEVANRIIQDWQSVFAR